MIMMKMSLLLILVAKLTPLSFGFVLSWPENPSIGYQCELLKVNTEYWVNLPLFIVYYYITIFIYHLDIDDDEIEDTDRIVLYDQLDGFLFQFQDQRQIFKLFLTFLPLLGLNNLYSDDDGDLLGFLGTQCFQDWLGINHPQGNILRSIVNKTVRG